MNIRNVSVGIVAIVVALFSLVLALRSCARATAPDTAAVGTAGHLTPCTADPVTGSCFPDEERRKEPFDWQEFMSMVREHQKSSPSSSARSSSWGSGSIFNSLLRRSRSDASSSAPASDGASLSASSSPSGAENVRGSATARVVIIGGDERSAGASDDGGTGGASGSRGTGGASSGDRQGGIGGSGAFGGGSASEGSSGGAGSFGGGGTNGAGSFGDSLIFGEGMFGSTGIGGSEMGSNEGAGVGGFQGYDGPPSSSDFPLRFRSFGGQAGRAGLQGSIGTVPSGTCLRSRSFLAMFDPDDLTTGDDGSLFPGLIDGDCPVTGAMLKGPESQNGFGGPLNDF